MTARVPLGLLFVCAGALWAQTQPAPLTMDEFAGDWKVSKQFTLAVAEAMPAEDYGFKPTPKQMSFGEQMVHIAFSSVYRFHQLTDAPPPFPLNSRPQVDKASAVRYLNQSFDYVIGLLPKITQEQMMKTFKVIGKAGRK